MLADVQTNPAKFQVSDERRACKKKPIKPYLRTRTGLVKCAVLAN